MSLLKPTDVHMLATAVVDNLVVAADPYAREASIFYWERGRPYTLAVVDAVVRADDPQIVELGKKLLAEPTDPRPYAALRSALVDLAGRADQRSLLAPIFDAAWLAECNSRLGYQVGPQYQPTAEPVISADDLATFPAGPALADPVDAEVLVAVPFRDCDTGGQRLRNALACLLALRDQSFPRHAYQVVVVEADEQSRWGAVLSRYADRYLFAAKTGAFNKSWAVNVGVVNTPRAAELVCIMDADVLPDRDFVARNVARFARPGTMAHLSYRHMFCLDPVASSRAIRARLQSRAPDADPDHLRGFLLRRPPGCCVWVRASAFDAIGGMDERFEGWGGEDNDFNYRLDNTAAFDAYDDPLLHLYHPATAALRADGTVINAHIPIGSWRPDWPIGRLDRFAPVG